MRKSLVLVIGLLATTVQAADLTGRWSGVVVPGNNADTVPMSVELRQHGTRLIGVAITAESGVSLLRDGVIAGDRIAFNIRVEGESVKFELTAAGDQLRGEAVGKRDNGSQDGPVAVNLERVNAAGRFTGTWRGTAEGLNPGSGNAEPFTLTLREFPSGAAGEITDSSDHDHALAKVKINGARITFEVDKLQAGLTLDGDTLSGTGTVNSGSAEEIVKLNLGRSRPGAETGISGRWDGAAEPTANQPSSISLRLHQDGTSITGKCIDASGKAFDIANASLRANKLIFDIADERGRLHFTLTLNGDELTGDAVDSVNPSTAARITVVKRLD